MTTLVALDPNMPIPDSLTQQDAAHPANIVRNALEIQNQAAEDARYDFQVPDRFRQRKEGFAPFSGELLQLSHINVLLVIGLCIFIAIFALTVRGTLENMYILVFTLACAALFAIASR
jgi:hypothetical protein